jgi:hypothetical protein
MLGKEWVESGVAGVQESQELQNKSVSRGLLFGDRGVFRGTRSSVRMGRDVGDELMAIHLFPGNEESVPVIHSDFVASV